MSQAENKEHKAFNKEELLSLPSSFAGAKVMVVAQEPLNTLYHTLARLQIVYPLSYIWIHLRLPVNLLVTPLARLVGLV